MIVGLVRVLLVSVSVEDSVGTVTPSTAIIPAETLEIVVSVACPSSTVPTPSAAEVEAVIPLIGNPVALVRVTDVGVPNTGVTRVGDVANTKEPEPVSSEITPASSADVVAACTDNLSVVTTKVLDVGIVVELIVNPATFAYVVPEAIVVLPRVGAE